MLVNVHVLYICVCGCVYVCGCGVCARARARTWEVNGITRVQREIVEASPQGRAASESAWLNDSASFQR